MTQPPQPAMKLSAHLEQKGLNLVGLPLTLTSGEASWACVKHSGFVRRVKESPEDYLLNLDSPIVDVPRWVLEADDLTVAIHFAAEGKTWAHQFIISDRRVQENGYLFLVGRTTGGEPPVWS